MQAGLPPIVYSLSPLLFHSTPWQFATMNFRNLFLSLFFVFALGFALVQAEEAKREPRGPKITSKVDKPWLCSAIDSQH